jgi:hypothetical protein
MISTGIDIYNLSKSDEIKERAETNRKIMNEVERLLDTKGELTEEKLEQLQNLQEAIEAAYAANNDNEVLRLFETFCTICKTIDGFIFSVNEFGWETFTFTFDTDLAYAYFEDDVHIAITLMEEIEAGYPSFASLPEKTQIEIIAAAIYVNMQSLGTKDHSITDCRKEAAAMLAVSLSTATALYEASLIGCAFSGPAAPGCCALASAGYGVSVGVSMWQYRRAVRRCG